MSRFRLLPAPAQQAVLRDHCAHARYVWNLAVEQHAPAPVYRAPNVLIFHPSNLPPGAGWQIVSGFNLPGRPGITVFSPTMVYASSQCTGS